MCSTWHQAGPIPYLNDDEESELFEFLKKCSSTGYGKTRCGVTNIAQRHVAEKQVCTKKDRINDGWRCCFLTRQEGEKVIVYLYFKSMP